METTILESGLKVSAVEGTTFGEMADSIGPGAVAVVSAEGEVPSGKTLRQYIVAEAGGFQLGRGDVCRVLMAYRAFEGQQIGGPVTLKVFGPKREMADKEQQLLSLFYTESDLLRKCFSPYIAQFYDLVYFPVGKGWVPAIARTYYPQTLAAVVRERRLGDREILEMVEEIALGLNELEIRNGRILVDLSPENLMKGPNWAIADLTMTVAEREPVDFASLGLELDNRYAPPELVGGGLEKPFADPRMEVYQTGMIVYACYGGEPLGTEAKVFGEGKISPDGIPPRVFPVLTKATSKDPSQRYSNSLAFALAFREALTPQEVK